MKAKATRYDKLLAFIQLRC